MLLKRFISGLLLAIVSFVLIIAGVFTTTLEVWLIAVFGVSEFYQLSLRKKIRPSKITGFLAVTFIVLSTYYSSERDIIYLLAGLLIYTMVVFLFRKDFHISIFLDAGVTWLGFLYVGWLLSFMIILRKIPGAFHFYNFTLDWGAGLVIFLVLGTCSYDIGAYLVGRLIGRTKLFPQVSPGKTVEGAMGGLLASLLISWWFGKFLGLPVLHIVILSVIMSAGGQLGDLWESALKRDVNSKDSGNIIIGHGGVLDRFDSIIFTAPLVYIYLRLFVLQL
ncbi:MAG: phosphatidate cytidylyltransferase [Firmicutes bacterium]|nr:phosphatidate cytidylyltransferase [Bacillota bacterium]